MSFILLAAAVVAAASAAGAAFAKRARSHDEPHGDADDASTRPPAANPADSNTAGNPTAGNPTAGNPTAEAGGARRKAPAPAAPAAKPSKSAAAKSTSPEVVDDAAVFARLPLCLGDVVSFDREERWLAGAIVARDGNEIVGALFLAPEGAKLEAVAAFSPPRREIFWMSPVQADSGLEPPTSLDFAGVVMQRRSRIPVTLTRMGQGAPHLGDTAIWAEYEASAGARAILIRGLTGVFAWSGAHCDEGEYDRMGKGG